ncbi:hypothetical protein [Saccharopolyspora griseoalba]|uniref:Helix-turn-helix domain-containing protein n=1 Tax=Saccharopolyspora griseoalba TaxID=1431848 RepID=A0ABW2LLD7_9PSEU
MGRGFSGEVAEWSVVEPVWGLREIAAYLHVSAEEALRRLRACGLVAATPGPGEPRWSAQAVIDARARLGAFVPHPR